MKLLLVLASVLASTPAFAQRFDVAPIVAYTTSVSLDRTGEDVDELKISDGVSWGARGTYFLTERFGIEGLWTYQEASLEMTSGGHTAEVMEMTLNQFHANAVYQFGASDARLTPFIFGGLGATFFSSDGFESETKFSWDVGAGVKWWLSERFGVEGRGRFKPTSLQSGSDEYCGPFGFCQNSLQVFDIAAGFVVRF
jgi:opacity protein-like surface antigen